MHWKPLAKAQITNVGVAVYPPGATFGPRRMVDYEFVWIVEGGAVAHYDQYRIEAPAGTVLLCRPGMTDRYEWSSKRRTVHAFFHFDLDVLPAGWPAEADWPLAHTLAQEDILRPLFRHVLRLHSLAEPMRSALLLPCLELMLKSFISGKFAVAAEPHAAFPSAVERALVLIRDISLQQPSPQVSLSELARAAHVTPEHLCRLFRKTLDLGPLECVRLARLERAAMLLARSNLSIKEITAATGFANPYHFSRKFRETYRHSPRAYRQAVCEGRDVPSNPVSQALLIHLASAVR